MIGLHICRSNGYRQCGNAKLQKCIGYERTDGSFASWAWIVAFGGQLSMTYPGLVSLDRPYYYPPRIDLLVLEVQFARTACCMLITAPALL